MPDQLSLELPTEPPNLPWGLRPMLARPYPTPFDSPNHVFQPLWGGLRVLAFVGSGPPRSAHALAQSDPARSARGLALLDPDGVDRIGHFPELGAVRDQLAAGSAVLDGEIVVVDRAGRLDANGLAARLAGRPGVAGRPGPPAVFLAFDLLHLDGRSLLGAPLHRRRDLLRRLVGPGGAVLVVPAVEADGRALHAAVVAQGLAGVLARLRTSPYLPGVRSRLWRFVPARPPADADLGSTPEAAAGAPFEEPSLPAAPVLAVFSRLPLDAP
jgi:hypothetical protein